MKTHLDLDPLTGDNTRHPPEVICEVVEPDPALRHHCDLVRESLPAAEPVLDWIARAGKKADRQADAPLGLSAVCRGELPWLRQERAIRPKIAAWFAQETGT